MGTHCCSSSRSGVALHWVEGGKAESLTPLPLPRQVLRSPLATWGHLEGTERPARWIAILFLVKAEQGRGKEEGWLGSEEGHIKGDRDFGSFLGSGLKLALRAEETMGRPDGQAVKG